MHATDTSAPPSRRLPRAERREQVARAAAAVFMRGGFDGTSMDDVARQAGVTRPIVYRIFESKEVLYRSVLDLVIDDLEDAFDPVAKRPRGDHAEQTIAAMVLSVARRHPDAFRLLWRHAAHEPEFRDFATQFKTAVIDYAIELLGASIADPVVRRWAAECVVSHLYESVCLWLDDGDPSRDGECAVMITAGIRAVVAAWTAG